MSDRNGWIVCVACLVHNFFRSATVYSFGVFVAEFQQLYHTSMAELDWMAVLVAALTDACAPIPTYLIHKIGRKGYSVCSLIGTLMLTCSCFASSFVNNISLLFFTYSFLTGIGSSLIFIPSTLAVNEFFPADHRYHVSATTAYQFAFLIATMTFSPLFSWMIQVTSTAFVVAEVTIFIVGTITSLLYLLENKSETEKHTVTKELEDASHNDKNLEQSKFNDSNWRNIFRTPKRFCWLFGMIVTFAIMMIPIYNLPHYMKSKGFGKMESSLSLVLYGFFQALVFVVLSPFAHHMKGKLIYNNIASCLLLALLFVIWPFFDPSFTAVMAFSSALGAIVLLSFGFINPTSMEVMSMNISISWTATCVSAGIGTLISPLLSGVIYDLRQSYDDVFLAVGISTFLNVLIFILIPVINLCKKKNNWIGVMTVCITGILSPLAAYIIHKDGKIGYAICSFIGTLVMSGGCFASSFVGHVSWLYLTFSILAGLGSSLQFMPSVLIVHEFFPSDHRLHVLATTAYQYALPSGIMVFSPLFAWIIKITSWRTAFVIAGVMMLVFGTISSLIFLLNKTLPEHIESQTVNKANEKLESKSGIEEQPHANNNIDSNWRDICGTPKRFCWLFGVLMTFATQLVTLFNLTHYMESKNYEKLESTTPLVLFSFVQFLALFVLSSIGHYMKGRLICCNIVSCLLVAPLFIVWSFVDPSYEVILVFSSVLGVSSTLSFGYMNPSSVENMSMKVSISWTASSVIAGIGTVLSPLLSGAIYDFRQSYNDVFLAVGIAAFFNGLIFIAIPVLDTCKLKQNNYETLK